MIENRYILCVVMTLMGVAAYIGSSEPDGSADPTLAARERIIRDLTLDARLWGKPVDVLAGSDLWVETKLINRSKRTSHRVVKPGEGSFWGVKEPYVYYTATVDRGDGTVIPLPDSPRGWWCGNTTISDWVQDAVELRPGEAISVTSGVALPFDFQVPGQVAVQVHYAYHAGAAKWLRIQLAPEKRGIMREVPEFELASRPVRFRVVRPLDIRVRVKRVLKAGESYRTADVVEVELVGMGDENQLKRLPTDCNGMVHLRADSSNVITFPYHEQPVSCYVNPVIPRPGEVVELFGGGRMTYPENGRWVAEKPGVTRIRAEYTPSSGSGRWFWLRSEWVEVRVEP